MEAHFQRLRFDDHPSDMTFDQFTIRKTGRRLPFPRRSKMSAHAVADESLDLRGRHASDAARLGFAVLQDDV
jgi:hypothetical protein